MKLVSVTEMKAIEREADAGGLTYAEMMENAGAGLADVILDFAEEDEELDVLGLVGPGNNGGDTLVALEHLAQEGFATHAYCIKRKTAGDELIKRLQDAGGEIISVEDDHNFTQLPALLESSDILLDGLLGTGIKLPLKGAISDALRRVKDVLPDLEFLPYVVAVDCPSGVDCDTGESADECIAADLTITMAAVKQGLLKFSAYDLIGELKVVDIGLTDEIESWMKITRQVADEDMVARILPERPNDSHKGTFGTALLAAGSVNYTGAALLSGKAAYRVGAGLVTMAVPAPLHAALAGHFPEATWLPLPHEKGFIERAGAIPLAQNLSRATALLVGPGFGLEDTTKDFLAKLLEAKLPSLVIDADGLKLLAKIPDWYKKLPAETILTPHPGEMSVLTGLSKDEIQSDRENVALKYAKEWGHVVVLKGAFTVIASPDGHLTVIPVASSALARAGTGDVLAGLIVGLRAQGVDAYHAAIAGAWIHGRAGLEAAEALGGTASVLAGDVLDAIPDVLSELEG